MIIPSENENIWLSLCGKENQRKWIPENFWEIDRFKGKTFFFIFDKNLSRSLISFDLFNERIHLRKINIYLFLSKNLFYLMFEYSENSD